MPRRRVLMLSHHGRAVRGGAPLADAALARALAEHGHTVEVWFYDDILPDWVKATWRQLLFPWSAALMYLRRHRAARWDVLESTAGDAWVLRLLLRLLPGPRPLVSIRTHGLEHRRADLEREWLRREGRRLGALTRAYHYHYHLGEVARDLRAADAVFLLNEGDRRYALERLRLPAAKVHIVPNGLPAEILRIPEPPDTPERPFRLLFLGAWSPAKGADLLPRIAGRLFRADPRFRLTCAGVQESVDRVLADFAPEDRSRVSVLPRYDWPELPGILDGHGIFLFPSRAEGCSLAFLEAMAGGLVPVTTRTGYAADLIRPGQNGFLAEAGDAEGYAAPILALAASPETALSIGRQARRAMADHSWSARAAERTAIWDSVPEGRR